MKVQVRTEDSWNQKINQKTEVYAISKLNDDLFIGSSESGMIQYTSNDSVIIYQKSDATGSIQGDDVWAMLKIDNNQLLVGTYGNGLSYFNAATQRFSQNKKQALFDSLRMQGTLIMYLMHDSKQRLWIATQRMGLYCYDAAIDSLTHFHPDEPVNKINDATVLTVYEDSNGNIWIGGFEKGIDVISTKGQLINHYEYNSLNKNTPGSNSITCFLRQKNLIWFGTIGGGLNSFDIENKKFYRLTEANGLPDNTVYGIINDDSDLWISTNRGLCRVIPYLNDTTLTILSRGYNTSDGLPANEFNQGGYYKDDDGIFYFGSVNGLVSFKPALIKDNPYKPKVILTSFKVFEKPYAIDSGIAYKKVIELNYNEDFFSFEFAAASYFLSEENQYAYLLEGFNKGWIQNGNRHYISFTNLSPGTYHLKIKASNNDGIWGDEKQLITIIINPPFWMTWWFRLMIVALIAGTIYQIVNTRIKRIKKEERRKADFAKRIAETETKALRAQMNPHFIFNSLNAIHKYIWEHEQTLASDYLTRFSKLMRMILENSSHQKIPLDKELECLRIYIELESLRFENKFDFKIQIHSEHDAEDILIPPLLLQPFAENAIIHGLMKKKEGQRLLDIQLKTTATDLICIIDDTGIGRKAAAEQRTATSHKSLGMSVTHDRIEIMNIESERKTQLSVTDKTDAEDKASGTRVEIILPLELQF